MADKAETKDAARTTDVCTTSPGKEHRRETQEPSIRRAEDLVYPTQKRYQDWTARYRGMRVAQKVNGRPLPAPSSKVTSYWYS